MTKGGPGTASMVMAMYGYQVSFSQSNMGYGSCISVAIFVLSLLVIGGSQGLIKISDQRKGGMNVMNKEQRKLTKSDAGVSRNYHEPDSLDLFTLLYFPDRMDGRIPL